jgi:translation initiation factor IF-3
VRGAKAGAAELRVGKAIKGIERVRVITADGEDLGELALKEALGEAARRGMDLVEVNRTGRVCRLRDIELEAQKIRDRERQTVRQQQKAKSETKKIRISPRTDAGSVQVKADQVARMLAKGQRVSIFVWVKTREDRVVQHEVSVPLLEALFEAARAAAGEDSCFYQEEPGLRGGNYSMMLVPDRPKAGASKVRRARSFRQHSLRKTEAFSSQASQK